MIEMLKQGGILRDIPGNTQKEALTNMVAVLKLPESLDRALLLKAILEREALMPTSIGNGIAVPHPRNPLIEDFDKPFVTIAFLQNAIDWQALDNIAVQTIILIVSASAKAHLHTLSRVHFFCQQDDFAFLLQNRASDEEIFKVVADIEKVWK